MQDRLGGVLLAGGVALSLWVGAAQACVAPDGAAQMRQAVVGWVNDSRRAKGLPALKVSAQLQSAATAHACDMAERGYFSHEGPGGPSFVRRLKKAGYDFRTANENIAETGSASVANVTGIWQGSSGHWANVIDPGVREIGVGVAEGGGRIYWVTDAGAR